eukprot:14548304-Ditylum_brightwellii.AAC.1
MRTALTMKWHSNPDVKRAVIVFTKTYSKKPRARPVSHVQAMHYSSRRRLSNLQALHILL